ncbi:hypothetical protein [Yinghuangia seranimata]|uniref:hypothetical protein n=1 Tax=Yinghuangia seranimata TaxID=408067 RepID=UPI00248BCC96|nr:hypothetical protein [Yinghuangia seranimata]MDI2125808.1 hypothetical protein [Yinghuangia seranimata]
MTSVQTHLPVGFSITVPDDWYEFDIHPASRDDNIRRAVNARIREAPELAEHRQALLKALRGVAREAWETGALYCGCMADEFDSVPLTANLTVSVVSTRSPTGELVDLDPRAMSAALKSKAARHGGDTWQRVSTVDIEDVGPAARTEGVEDLPVPGTPRKLRSVTMQTFVRMPGVNDYVCVVTATSPRHELQEMFLELFDTVSGTFRFEYPA